MSRPTARYVVKRLAIMSCWVLLGVAVGQLAQHGHDWGTW